MGAAFQNRLLVAGYVLSAIGIGLLSLPFPRTTQDSPTATYIAQVILEGGAPYRDAFDVRSPGSFFIIALQIALFGSSALAMRVFDLLWQLLVAFLIGRFAERYAGTAGSSTVQAAQAAEPPRFGAVGFIAGALYLMVYYAQDVGTWVQPDGMLNLFLLASVHFAIRASERGRLLDWGIAAMFVGLASLTKLPFGIFGAAYLAMAFPRPFELRLCVTRYAALACGLLFPFGLLVAHLYVLGGLREAFYSQAAIGAAYSAYHHDTLPPDVLVSALQRPKTFPLYVILACAVVGFRQARGVFSRWQALFWFWAAVGVGVAVAHGSYNSSHLLPILPPLIILGAPLAAKWNRAAALLSVRNWLLLAVLVTATYPTVIWLRNSRGVIQSYVQNWPDRDLWAEVGRYIKERTQPHETIYTWGGITAVYIHAERKAACFVIPSLFFRFSSPSFNLRGECIAQIETNAPPYIVVGKERRTIAGMVIVDSSMATFPELEAYFKEHYELEKEFRACWVYRRKTTAPHEATRRP